MKQWFWVLDALVVVAFAVIGRNDHGFVSDVWDYARVASPFLLGLGASVFVLRAWRRPTDWRTGVALALGTVLIGMVLRRIVWDDGTAQTFILVTTAFLVAGMVGWRLVAAVVERVIRSRRAAAA